MRMRIRGPSGSSIIELASSDTVGELLRLIREKTSLEDFELRHGFPPTLLTLDPHDRSKPLSELGVVLDGQQLLVSAKEDRAARPEPAAPSSSSSHGGATSTARVKRSAMPRAKTKSPGPTPAPPSPPRPFEKDPPQVAVPERGGTLVLRVMPDDNSCLFRAFGSAALGGVDSVVELRSMVADAIQAAPHLWNELMLGKPPDEYCRWIKAEHSWGGFIELNLLAEHFDMEVCSIDVQTLRVDCYNSGRPRRCIIVYSGIHYDTIALSPSIPPYTQSYSSPDLDTRVFDSADDLIKQKALELCAELQRMHYYTDTAAFNIRCNVCGAAFVGERGATEHAKDTGHYDFGEEK